MAKTPIFKKWNMTSQVTSLMVRSPPPDTLNCARSYRILAYVPINPPPWRDQNFILGDFVHNWQPNVLSFQKQAWYKPHASVILLLLKTTLFHMPRDIMRWKFSLKVVSKISFHIRFADLFFYPDTYKRSLKA